MTITAQIKHVGQIREFTTTQNGLETKRKAVELRLQSGQNEFVADLYGEGVDQFESYDQTGRIANVELTFSVKDVDRKDGQGKFACMRGTITYVQLF